MYIPRAVVCIVLGCSLLFGFAAIVLADADLSLTLSGSPDPAVLGTNITYTLLIVNSGPEEASNVVLADSLPTSMTFQAITAPDDWACTAPQVDTTGTISCTKNSLAPSETATISVIVKPTAAGVITNTALVSGGDADPNTKNNSASIDTTVVPGPER